MSLAFTDPSLCTAATCSLNDASVDYFPSLAGNALYLSIFSLLLVLHLAFGVYYRTWGYMVGLVGGLALEVAGYAARVQMHFNPWLSNPFLVYIICLTIGPVFLSAAIYICFTRIVLVYGVEHARFSPATYTNLFIGSDILSLILQAAGGAIADTANTQSATWTGIHIMIAGLSFQVFSLVIYYFLALDFAWAVHKARVSPKGLFCSTKHFYVFLWLLGVAWLTIFIRSTFRVAELAGGFGGKLANDEVTFMVLEGAMIVIASVCLTVVHPGLIFKDSWKRLGAVNNWFGNRSYEMEMRKTSSQAERV